MNFEIMPTKIKKRYFVYIEQELMDRIERMASSENLSRSRVIRMLLRKGLLKV